MALLKRLHLSISAYYEGIVPLPNEAELELDVRNTKFLDFDILDTINDFLSTNAHKKINVDLITEKGVFEGPLDLYRTIFPTKNRITTF